MRVALVVRVMDSTEIRPSAAICRSGATGSDVGSVESIDE